MTTTRKRPLNIGLGKMLSQSGLTNTKSLTVATATATGEQLRYIPLDAISPGQYQPRHDFDAESLQELAESIKAQGVLQPIVLRQTKPQQYEIIAGERRWRAAQLAGLDSIPALIKEISDQAALAIGLIENIQRENLNALEEAKALHRLLSEFNLTHEDVAHAVGKSRTMVSNLLRLLQLDEPVKILLERGDLEMGHARALLALPSTQQHYAAKEVVNKQLSVRETEKLVKHLLEGSGKLKAKPTKLNPNLMKLQQELSDQLGTKVSFMHRASGGGKLVIEYLNLDILDGVLKKIQK